LACLEILNCSLTTEHNPDGLLPPVRGQHNKRNAGRVDISQWIDASEGGPTIARRTHKSARSRTGRILLHRISVALARVCYYTKPITWFTCIGKKVKRRRSEAVGCVDRHATSLTVSSVAIDLHASRRSGVTTVRVAGREWNVCHFCHLLHVCEK